MYSIVFVLMLRVIGAAADGEQFYDLGGGVGMFLSPAGQEEGPCIDRLRQTSTTGNSPAGAAIGTNRAVKTAPSAATGTNHVVKTAPSAATGTNRVPTTAPSATNGTKRRPKKVSNADVHTQTLAADPLNPQDRTRPTEWVPVQDPAGASSPSPATNPSDARDSISKWDIIDYSKLSNKQINKLMKDAARKRRLQKLGRHQGPLTILESMKIDRGLVPGQIPTFAQMMKDLRHMKLIAKLQQDMLKLSKQTVPSRRRRLVRREANELPEKKRLSKRQIWGDMHPSICSCIEISDVESDYIVHSPKRYACNPGLICACHHDGVT